MIVAAFSKNKAYYLYTDVAYNKGQTLFTPQSFGQLPLKGAQRHPNDECHPHWIYRIIRLAHGKC